jgi:hypothetical protein
MSRKSKKNAKGDHKNHAISATQDIVAAHKALLLDALMVTGANVTRAAALAKLERRTHYRYMDEDPEYAKAFKEITEVSLDGYEYIVHTLAHDGIDEKTRLAAATKMLQARGKSRGWGTENRNLEHSGKIETDSKIEVVRVVHFPSNNTDTTAIPLPASWETATSIHKPG